MFGDISLEIKTETGELIEVALYYEQSKNLIEALQEAQRQSLYATPGTE